MEKCTKVKTLKKYKGCWNKIIYKREEKCSSRKFKEKCETYCRRRSRCYQHCETLPMSCTPCTSTEPAKCSAGKKNLFLALS